MKRILIVTPSFAIGGTNSSLSAFLSQINPKELKVDVLSRNHQGYYRDEFLNCNIITENAWVNDRILYGSFIKKFGNIILRIIRRLLLFLGYDIINLYTRIGGVVLNTKQYDAVLSYQEDLSFFVANLPAKKRIAWIRCEYSRYYEIHHHKNETDIYKRIDTVVCVSEFAKKSFLKYYPQFENKTTVINNCMNSEEIRLKAKEVSIDERFDNKDFTIVSIGRIDRVKQFEQIPLIAKKIEEHTMKPFKWYIIGGSRGDSELDSLLQNRIEDNHLESKVILLGEKTNVYPYLAKADVFVHTSKSETFSRVVNEAKVLGTPPIINTYDCAPEFIQNGKDGYIIENEKMGDFISDIINHPEKLIEVRRCLNETNYNNETILNRTMNLL